MVLKCGTYSANDLTERVTLQQATRVTDGRGGWSETWADLATVYAKVRHLSGNEVWRFDRLNAVASLMVVIRYRAGVTPRHRLLIRGVTHNITDVRNVDMADRWLEIAVQSGVPS